MWWPAVRRRQRWSVRPILFSAGNHHQNPSSPADLLQSIITSGVGSLDDMESTLDRLGIIPTSSLLHHTIESCCTSTRRLLRFLSWCRKHHHPQLLNDQSIFDHAIRAFSRSKDITAMKITMAHTATISIDTFSAVTHALVRSNMAAEAIRLFKNMESKTNTSCVPIVNALCEKGHSPAEAQRIFWHRRHTLSPADRGAVYRALLHGWCAYGNAREARRIVDEMKSIGIPLGLVSYHDFLRCICSRNLRFNPSALVPENDTVMTEMRSSGVTPTAVSFNILLSALCKSRRVKESSRTLASMPSRDAASYYLVARVLYLMRRFVKGHRVLDQMVEEGVVPVPRFYHALVGVLCGVEEVEHALKVFERMKKWCGGDCGPTFDLLISKLCRNGRFDEGTRLWDEAVERGVVLRCSSYLLDPLKTEVFEPRRSLSGANIDRVVKKRKKVKVKRKKDGAT